MRDPTAFLSSRVSARMMQKNVDVDNLSINYRKYEIKTVMIDFYL